MGAACGRPVDCDTVRMSLDEGGLQLSFEAFAPVLPSLIDKWLGQAWRSEATEKRQQLLVATLPTSTILVMAQRTSRESPVAAAGILRDRVVSNELELTGALCDFVVVLLDDCNRHTFLFWVSVPALEGDAFYRSRKRSGPLG